MQYRVSMTKLIVSNMVGAERFSHRRHNVFLAQALTSKNLLVLAIWIELGVMLVHYIYSS